MVLMLAVAHEPGDHRVVSGEAGGILSSRIGMRKVIIAAATAASLIVSK